MRKLLIFFSVILVFAFMYYLVYYSITSSKISENGYKQAQVIVNIKLSMKQIDSLTSVENYKFTIENFSQDEAKLKPGVAKANKI
jgi:hypothetical protein